MVENPGWFYRLKQSMRFFRVGWSMMAKQAGGPFAWPTWRENIPQWATTDFQAYVEEAFNLNSPFYSAVMYKARSKMSAPLKAYDNDGLLPLDHPLSKLVMRPNPHQGWAEFQALLEIYFNLGNAFVHFIRPESGGLPAAMYALRPDRVFIIPEGQTIKGYLYVPEGKSYEDGLPILREDMLHVKLPNPSDPLEGLGFGMAPTPVGRNIDIDNNVTRFLKLFFQNGAMILGLLKFDVPMDDESIAIVKRRWAEKYGGVDNWMEPGVLDSGGSYQRIGATFEEMGFDQIDERTESRILGPLGVPPILIGSRMGLKHATYSNYETARRAYWEDTAVPELQLFESEWQYYLQSDDGGFVAYDFSRVPALQKDIPGLIDSAFKLWQMGRPANVALTDVGLQLPEVAGGNIGYISGNVVPAGFDSSSEETTSEGAIEAEEDERKRLKHREGIQADAVTCPLCHQTGVMVYDSLCVCNHCKCTFHPDHWGIELNGYVKVIS
jgi:HK97 family phage portal protein